MARNRIPSCSPTTGASIIPKVTNMCSDSHLLLSSLQPSFSHWGGREGRAVKKGLPMIIARYMNQCSFLDLWAITHWWGTLGFWIDLLWESEKDQNELHQEERKQLSVSGQAHSRLLDWIHFRALEPGSCLKVIADKLFEVPIDTLTNCCFLPTWFNWEWHEDLNHLFREDFWAITSRKCGE